MKRLVLLALLTLTFPLASFADTWDFTNTNGTLMGTAAGLTLGMTNPSATLRVISDSPRDHTAAGDLGSVDFKTGTLTGTLAAGGTFAAGGSFLISLSDAQLVFPKGNIFIDGMFSGAATWTPEGSGIYLLTGKVVGTLKNVGKVHGFTSQLYYGTVTNGTFTGTLGSGNTILTTAPEPSTLGLLGTGLVGLAGVLRKKLRN